MLKLKKYRFEITFLVLLILIGQVLFSIYSKTFTTPYFENNIYATTGVMHKSEDLHKLNEAAHYFGQTMIGWIKFPNFMAKLSDAVQLPGGSSMSAHIQERQNIIFTIITPSSITPDRLVEVKDYIQSKIDEYNAVSRTQFVLTNLDYQQIEIKNSYVFGALITFVISILMTAAILFIRKEFF